MHLIVTAYAVLHVPSEEFSAFLQVQRLPLAVERIHLRYICAENQSLHSIRDFLFPLFAVFPLVLCGTTANHPLFLLLTNG
jgi:hypothetical protein